MMAAINRIYLDSPYEGTRMMLDLLRQSGSVGVSRCKFISLMRKMDI
jgi:hypothetical protein